jgi:Icc-related predicted phosphoesterase
VKLVILSDSHGFHPWLDMPEGDVLIHCGDWCKDYGSVKEMKAFADWIASLPYKRKIVIAGNHDFPAQDNDAQAKGNFRKRDIIYLKDSGVELDGVKFWGSPWQPEFCDMAFNLPRGEALWDKWRRIPKDIDVLISHGPPQDILDNAVPPGAIFGDNHVGCDQLLRRVRQVKPKLHCFGHVHSGRGIAEHDGTWFVNASIVRAHIPMGSKPSMALAEEHGGLNAPIVFDLPKGQAT